MRHVHVVTAILAGVCIALVAALIYVAMQPQAINIRWVTGEPELITTTPLPAVIVTATPSHTPVVITATFGATWTPLVPRISDTPMPTASPTLTQPALVSPTRGNVGQGEDTPLASIFLTATAAKAQEQER